MWNDVILIMIKSHQIDGMIMYIDMKITSFHILLFTVYVGHAYITFFYIYIIDVL